MWRRLRLLAVAALAVVLLAGCGWAGVEAGIWLDQRYRERRFVYPRTVCPLAVNRDGSIISPMCAPVYGW